jgi:eukaryotic-like serine/threonine-protein kinase
VARGEADLATAVDNDQKALDIWRAQFGNSHPYTARYALLLAHDLKLAGQGERAATLAADAQPVFERAFPADSVFRKDENEATGFR